MRPDLARRLLELSKERGKPVEKLVEEAVELYIKLASYKEHPPRVWKPCW